MVHMALSRSGRSILRVADTQRASTSDCHGALGGGWCARQSPPTGVRATAMAPQSRSWDGGKARQTMKIPRILRTPPTGSGWMSDDADCPMMHACGALMGGALARAAVLGDLRVHAIP